MMRLALGVLWLCAARLGAQGVSGSVFIDRNGNGTREPGEPGVARVAVSNQHAVVVTDGQGRYALESRGTGVVYASLPEGYAAAGPWWRAIPGGGGTVGFALTRSVRSPDFTFVHASDTHISAASRGRTERLLALLDSIKPAMALITGDLVRDALRVGEAEATGYYTLFNEVIGKSRRPIWTVPGNHEVFGIERDKSGVASEHPLFARAMYRHYRGPDYYSFNAGGVHFVALNTVDIDGPWYYGHVDSVQLAWLARDLATVPPSTPVITFNHIPFYSALELMKGYDDRPPAPSLITVAGATSYRHVVSNASAVLAALKGRPYPIALGGHVHAREVLRYAGIGTRFEQAAAIVGPNEVGGVVHPSGITVYRVRGGRVGEGLFIPLGIP